MVFNVDNSDSARGPRRVPRRFTFGLRPSAPEFLILSDCQARDSRLLGPGEPAGSDTNEGALALFKELIEPC